jgi:AbrB family looped-hinge helix DNA binding protein
MKSAATISSKGQITIPKRFRDKLGIKKSTLIEIETTADGFVAHVVRGRTLHQL